MSGDNSQGDKGASKGSDEVSKLKEQYEGENYKLRESNRQLKEQMDKIQADLKAKDETASLASKNAEDKAKHWEVKYQEEQNLRKKSEQEKVEGRKNGKIAAELLKLGLRPEVQDHALSLVDKSRVFFDEQTGTVIGAEETAKAFAEMAAKQKLGFFGEMNLNVNHNSSREGKIVNDTRGMTHQQRIAHWEKQQTKGG